nr:heme ABC transporter permease [Sphingopyxis sp.]
RSVVWWNSLHQPASITTGGSAIAWELLWPLGLTLAGFTMLFAAIVLMRMRSILSAAKVEARLRRLANG